MGQLYWPETSGIARYSIPAHQSPSKSKALLRQTYQNSLSIPSTEQASKLLEIVEGNESSANEIEHAFDGLTSLDENQLDQMIETDLVSSSNG
jgi:hypothetical protein